MANHIYAKPRAQAPAPETGRRQVLTLSCRGRLAECPGDEGIARQLPQPDQDDKPGHVDAQQPGQQAERIADHRQPGQQQQKKGGTKTEYGVSFGSGDGLKVRKRTTKTKGKKKKGKKSKTIKKIESHRAQ